MRYGFPDKWQVVLLLVVLGVRVRRSPLAEFSTAKPAKAKQAK